MDRISIYCEQKSLFVNPEVKGDEVLVEAFSFSTVPAWVTKTYLWQLLQKDNKIKVIREVSDVKEVEAKEITKETIENVEESLHDNDPKEPESVNDNELTALTEMSAKQLYALCKDHGIDVVKQKSKAYYLEVLANNNIH